jgi:hypothetical protein
MTKSIKIMSIVFLFLISSIPLAFADPLQDQFYNEGQEVFNAPMPFGTRINFYKYLRIDSSGSAYFNQEFIPLS